MLWLFTLYTQYTSETHRLPALQNMSVIKLIIIHSKIYPEEHFSLCVEWNSFNIRCTRAGKRENVIRMTLCMAVYIYCCVACMSVEKLSHPHRQPACVCVCLWYIVQVYIIYLSVVCCAGFGSIHSRRSDVEHKKRKLMRFIWHSHSLAGSLSLSLYPVHGRFRFLGGILVTAAATAAWLFICSPRVSWLVHAHFSCMLLGSLIPFIIQQNTSSFAGENSALLCVILDWIAQNSSYIQNKSSSRQPKKTKIYK